jgi:hypothetical protein
MFVMAAALCATAAGKARPSRPDLANMEKVFNDRIQRLNISDPFDLLGSTRGFYLDGYGAIFTAEVNLVVGPAITPFRPALTPKEITALHVKKVQRLATLKEKLRELLTNLAISLVSVPGDEQIAVGVSLVYFSWEQRENLPSQVLMYAPRQALTDAVSKKNSLDAIVRIEEF